MSSPPNIDFINLNRLVARLEKNILEAEVSIEYRLRTSSFQRAKIGVNVDYAKKLLLKLEKEATNIKVLSKQQETQADLLRKRYVLNQISEKLQHLDDTAIEPPSDDETEDLLTLYGPSIPSDHEPPQESHTLWESSQHAPILSSPPPSTAEPQVLPADDRDLLFPSTLRSRTNAVESATKDDTAHTTSTSISKPTFHETLLTHNRTEQESLTTNMLTLAQQLRAKSQAISDALDADSSVVNNTINIMDKSTGTLEAAQRSMGYLVKMSEGTGWWGRIMLYFWIAGLAFLAFALVVFMPKLRF